MQVFDLNYMQRVNDISINDAQHLIDILRSFIDQRHARTVENIDMIDLFSIVNHVENARDIDDILMQLFKMQCTQRAIAYELNDQNDDAFITHERKYALYARMRSFIADCDDAQRNELIKMMQKLPRF